MDYSSCEKLLENELTKSVFKFTSEGFDENFDVLTQLDCTIDLLFSRKYDECYSNCEILLDFVWEKLNTGHWKNVPIFWRKLYTSTSCLAALSQFFSFRRLKCIGSYCEKSNKNDEELKKIIKTCDMGLLMGCPIENDILSTLASYLHQYLSEQKPTVFITTSIKTTIDFSLECEAKQNINYLDMPSIYEFQQDYFIHKKPVIIKNCLKMWPALNERKWDVEYIMKVARARLVPIEIGSKYTDDTWSQKLMTIGDFVEKYIMDPNCPQKAYLAQYQLFDQIKELSKDIMVPDYCAIGDEDIEINAWFGPGGTISPLHRDQKENIFCQVFGSKSFRLYSPEHSNLLHPYKNHLLATTSQIDVENPDLSLCPQFFDIPYTEFTLQAGDMLYLPSMYWHYVKSLSTSFSVSFWWKRDEETDI